MNPCKPGIDKREEQLAYTAEISFYSSGTLQAEPSLLNDSLQAPIYPRTLLQALQVGRLVNLQDVRPSMWSHSSIDAVESRTSI